MLRRWAMLGMCAWAVLWPGRALGWTDAHVRGVTAHVEVRPDGHARVSLELLVRIHAGWLESLEVAGLDPDFELDESKPPWAVSADDPAVKFSPSVRVLGEGRLQLGFRGRNSSPRRGALRIGIVYTTTLAHRATEGLPDGRIRVRWTLPPWRSGLDGVQIAVTTPAGALPAPAMDDDPRATVGFDRYDAGDRTVLLWQRAHLPRTVAWTVEVDVPEDAMAPELAAPAQPPRRKPRILLGAPPPPSLYGPWAVAALLAGFALLGAVTFRRSCRRQGASTRPLVPLPHSLRALAMVAFAGAAVRAWSDDPRAGLACLGAVALLSLERAPRLLTGAPRLGRWRPAQPACLRRARRARWARRLGLHAPLDLGTPTGLTALAAAVAVVLAVVRWEGAAVDGHLTGALALLLVPLLTGTRWHLPSSPELRLHRLIRLARRLRGSVAGGAPFALLPVVHRDSSDRWQDARLRISPAHAPADLLRLDLAVGERMDLGGRQDELVLVAVSRRGSAVDAALASCSNEGVRVEHVGDRVARIIPVPGPPDVVLQRVVGAMEARAVAPRPAEAVSPRREAGSEAA